MTAVPATAITSGARVLDLIELSPIIFVAYRLMRWFWRHWYVFLILITFLFFQWWHFILALLSLPVLLYGYVWWSNRGRRYDPRALARASWCLARARIGWRSACAAAGLIDGPKRPRLISWKRPPKIANYGGTALAFTLNLKRIGMTVNHLEETKDYFAAGLNARRTRVQRITPGIAKLTIEWEKNIHKSAIISMERGPNETQLPRFELDQDVLLEMDTSLLVVGESGSGKSNLTWHCLNELNRLTMDQVLTYRLYVIDPKKVELAELIDCPYTVMYSDTPSTADDVIERFYTDMMETFERMKRDGIRKVRFGPAYRPPVASKSNPNPKHTPVEEGTYPLNILICDELLLTKQARQGIDSHLAEILSAGRAAGFIVLANSQLGQVDALGRIRDLFPQRVCMAVKSADLTSAVLGPRAEERGAKCTEITEKGVGYIYTDFAGSFQRFRPPHIDDVSQIAQGGIWTPHGRVFSFAGQTKRKQKLDKQTKNWLRWGKPGA